jgi:hypothetical protein
MKTTDMDATGMTTTDDRALAGLVVGGLAVGAVLGLIGDQLPLGTTHVLLLLISSLGLVVGTALLAYWHLRRRRALVGAGFAILTVAEMLIWATGGPLVGGEESFAAGAAFYVPALLLVAAPAVLPVWARVAAGLAAVPFGALATVTLTGGAPAPVLQDVGYGLLTVALIGWAIDVLRESRTESVAGRLRGPERA